MTYYIGVDIAKYDHVACIINHLGEIIKQPFTFKNNKEGYALFLDSFSSFDKNEVLVGFESTAHYHENLYQFLSNLGINCYLINPILTKRFRGLNIRNAKTDKVDSLTIASFIAFNHPQEQPFVINELYTLCTLRLELIQKCSDEKIRLTAFLDRTFPELKPLIGNSLYTKGYLHLLKSFNTAALIKKTRSDKLYNTVNEFKTFVTKDRISQIKSLAANSVGFHSDAISISITSCVCQIELLQEQRKFVDAKVVQIMKDMNSPILKIPGMGYIQAAYILSTIKNIARFDSASKVVAYAGLDPIIRQSGTFNASRTRMSKRGNKMLRYALIWSANNVRKRSKTLEAYYQKKRSEGKSHYNALGHCAKKLTNYIFFVLSNPDKEFELK